MSREIQETINQALQKGGYPFKTIPLDIQDKKQQISIQINTRKIPDKHKQKFKNLNIPEIIREKPVESMLRLIYEIELRLKPIHQEKIQLRYAIKPIMQEQIKVKTPKTIKQVMAEIEQIEPRETKEVVEKIENTIGEETDGTEKDILPETDKGLQFIQKMMDSNNRVIQNSYGQPVVELITHESMKEQVKELIEQWDLNPSGPRVISQPPSFEDERPEVSETLVGFQFLLDEGDELDSSGYDLEKITDELKDEPVVATKSARADVKIF